MIKKPEKSTDTLIVSKPNIVFELQDPGLVNTLPMEVYDSVVVDNLVYYVTYSTILALTIFLYLVIILYFFILSKRRTSFL